MFHKNKMKRIFKKKILKKEWVQTQTLKGHTGCINSLNFNASNQIFATASEDKTVRLWDSTTFKTVSLLKEHSSQIKFAFFSQKYPHIFSGGDDLIIRCWDIEYNKTLRKFHGHLGTVLNLTFHPILDVFFSCSRDNTIRIWDPRTQKEIQILRVNSKAITCMIANAETPHLITGSFDKKICLWDFVSGKFYRIIKTHKNGIKQLSKHPTNYSFLSLSSESLISWRKDGLILNKIQNKSNSNNCFSVNNKKQVALGFSQDRIKSFYLKKKKNEIMLLTKPKSLLSGTNKNILNLTFDFSNKKIFAAGEENDIKIFEKKWQTRYLFS